MKNKYLISLITTVIASFSFASEFDELKSLLDQNLNEEAVERINHYADANPDSSHTAFLEGFLALNQQNWDQAVELLKKANDLESENSMFLSKLALAYIRKADHAQPTEQPMLYMTGVDYFKKAEALDESNIEAQMALIGFYSHAPAMVGGSMQKAYEHAEILMKYNKDLGTQQVAQLDQKAGKVAEAGQE
ncbi:MAG: hypothetical protein AB3N63_13185 [Puniceicoccaceae bacterium]